MSIVIMLVPSRTAVFYLSLLPPPPPPSPSLILECMYLIVIVVVVSVLPGVVLSFLSPCPFVPCYYSIGGELISLTIYTQKLLDSDWLKMSAPFM